MNKRKKKTEAVILEKIQQNTKKSDSKGKKTETSILKKSELSLIFLGASLITLIVFFVFFRPSVNKKKTEYTKRTTDIQALEKRIVNIEELLHTNKTNISSDSSIMTKSIPSMDSYIARVERVETALSVKFNVLTKRLNSIEKKITILSKQISNTAKINKTVTKINKTSTRKNIKKIKVAKHIRLKKIRTKKQGTLFHTVKKGDTLYSISKKYKITIRRLKELNRLSNKSTIYPGDTMIIK